MLRAIIALLASLMPIAVSAAPHLFSAPYKAPATIPDSATLTINGGAPIACELTSTDEGVVPRCDLSSIKTSGTYTLVMTVCKASEIINDPNAATNTVGGCVSSANFRYELRTGAVPTPPVLSVGP
jgi:hypothetical protein